MRPSLNRQQPGARGRLFANSLFILIAVAIMLGCRMLDQVSASVPTPTAFVTAAASDPWAMPSPVAVLSTITTSPPPFLASPTPGDVGQLPTTTRPAPTTVAAPQTQTVSLFLPLVSRQVASQTITGQFIPVSGTTISFWLYLPANYRNDPDHPWPLVLFLHGIGERGSDPSVIPNQGLPKIIKHGQDFPFIVLAPQAPAGLYWNDVTSSVMALLDQVRAQQAVDDKRIYLTGISMGGYGATNLAEQYASRFAALVPIAGGYYWDPAIAWQFRYTLNPTRPPPDSFCVVKDIPTWLFAGQADDIIPYVQSVTVRDKLQACGGAPQLTLYPGVGHISSWEEAYADSSLYTWLLNQSKN